MSYPTIPYHTYLILILMSQHIPKPSYGAIFAPHTLVKFLIFLTVQILHRLLWTNSYTQCWESWVIIMEDMGVLCRRWWCGVACGCLVSNFSNFFVCFFWYNFLKVLLMPSILMLRGQKWGLSISIQIMMPKWNYLLRANEFFYISTRGT